MRLLSHALFLTIVSTPCTLLAQHTWTAVQDAQRVSYCRQLWTPLQDVVFLRGDIDDNSGLYRSDDGGKSFVELPTTAPECRIARSPMRQRSRTVTFGYRNPSSPIVESWPT